MEADARVLEHIIVRRMHVCSLYDFLSRAAAGIVVMCARGLCVSL